jgi:putative membrane protein
LVLGVVLTRQAAYGWLAFALLPVVGLVGYLSWRDTGLGFSHDGRVGVLRARWLKRVTAIVPRRRVQYASASASLFQRRRDVASCTLATAAGNQGARFTARDLDEGIGATLLSWSRGSAQDASAQITRTR